LKILETVQSLYRSAQGSETISVYLSPFFWALLALALVIERAQPATASATARRGIFSAGFAQDAVYFGLTSAFRVLVLSFYVGWLQRLYASHLDFLTVQAVAAWPMWAKAAVAIAITDFLGWFHHLVRHKVPFFWRLHSIHHSQRDMNILTDLRYHPLEYAITQTILFLPMLMFGAAFPVIFGYAFFQQWYTKLYHASIRTNMGFLRYVLVTPQSHRIHHSTQPAHFDCNYGVVFSIWDRMFGTQNPDAESYPETGVDDPTFPYESGAGVKDLLRSTWAQLVYPFRASSSV
jgi:sterol desaturase/sphingolipid hydroxylase (fatty acid hydroxylase superfamily)